jgi:hypothetical protein
VKSFFPSSNLAGGLFIQIVCQGGNLPEPEISGERPDSLRFHQRNKTTAAWKNG